MTTIFAVLLLNTFGLALHAAAMPATARGMGGMNHETSSSTNCPTICRSAVFTKEEVIDRVDEEDNDDFLVHYDAQLQATILGNTATKSQLYAAHIKLPIKIPLYLLYEVLRV